MELIKVKDIDAFRYKHIKILEENIRPLETEIRKEDKRDKIRLSLCYLLIVLNIYNLVALFFDLPHNSDFTYIISWSYIVSYFVYKQYKRSKKGKSEIDTYTECKYLIIQTNETIASIREFCSLMERNLPYVLHIADNAENYVTFKIEYYEDGKENKSIVTIPFMFKKSCVNAKQIDLDEDVLGPLVPIVEDTER